MVYQTQFGSLDHYVKGTVEVIDDDPRNYVFSNIFEVAAQSRPYERVAVAKNFEYVIEAVRAEGVSPWYTANHDEFVLCMCGEIEVQLATLDVADSGVDSKVQGSQALSAPPVGRRMGRLVLRQGHMGLLPRGSAYQFRTTAAAVALMQTIEGPLTVQKWSQICLGGLQAAA